MPAVFRGPREPDERPGRTTVYTRALAEPWASEWPSFLSRLSSWVSAHWYINASAVTAMTRPRTIHDFYGFPDELFAVSYPAPGDPASGPSRGGCGTGPAPVGGHGRRQLGHRPRRAVVGIGPCLFLYADVPVVQLAIDATKPFEYPPRVGRFGWRRCATNGVLVVASGNVVHNLGLMDGRHPDSGSPNGRTGSTRTRGAPRPRPLRAMIVEADACSSSTTAWRCRPRTTSSPLLYLAGLAEASGEAARRARPRVRLRLVVDDLLHGG